MKKELLLDQNFVSEVIKNKAERKLTKTQKRNHVIIPEFVGANIGVYNGKIYTSVFIVEDMVGHKLGEFSLTRKLKPHKTQQKSDAKTNRFSKKK